MQNTETYQDIPTLMREAIESTGIDPDDFHSNITGETQSLLYKVAGLSRQEIPLDEAQRLVKIFPSTKIDQWCDFSWMGQSEMDYFLDGDRGRQPMVNSTTLTLRPMSPPGDTILDWMKENQVISSEMADKLDISIDNLIQVLFGDRRIDYQLAEKLANVCGNSPEFWLKRQANFDAEQDSGDRPSIPSTATDPRPHKNTAELIVEECDKIKALLLTKNRQYGDSALNPVRIFSQADPIEQIKVRIDDKLSRLASGQLDDVEDVISDLIGYLVLLRVAIAIQNQS